MDLDEANSILDSIGLDKRDTDGFRIDPATGKTLVIRLLAGGFFSSREVVELVTEQMIDVGLKINQRIGNYPQDWNEMQMVAYRLRSNHWNNSGYVCDWIGAFHCLAVAQWKQTQGAGGVDPNTESYLAPIARILDLYEQGKSLPLEGRIPLGKEISRIFLDNIYAVGTVGEAPGSIGYGLSIVNKKLRNTPEGPIAGGYSRKELYFFVE